MFTSGPECTDSVIRRQLHSQTMRRRPPFVLGYDVVEEIDQLGDGVREYQLGERVAERMVLWSNAAYRLLPPSGLMRLSTLPPPPARRLMRTLGGATDFRRIRHPDGVDG